MSDDGVFKVDKLKEQMLYTTCPCAFEY